MPKRKPPALPGTPAWMMTFSDITTLLLTFFILIMTFSTVEKEKFEKARGSFKGAFGVVSSEPFRSRPHIEARRLDLNDRVRNEGAESPRRMPPDELATELQNLIDGNQVQLDSREDRWRLRLPTAYAFLPGRAQVRPQAVGLYRRIARKLRDYPNVIVFEGHTDDDFTPSESYASDWDIAGARAASVAEIFRREGFPTDRMALRSYGSAQPEVRNDTTMMKARNRRVDILVMAADEKGTDR